MDDVGVIILGLCRQNCDHSSLRGTQVAIVYTVIVKLWLVVGFQHFKSTCRQGIQDKIVVIVDKVNLILTDTKCETVADSRWDTGGLKRMER